jgi:type I restriction enzyme R subunit
MLGRATRLCPEIDKEFFRIYDAVDLYAALEDYTTMKPVVKRPNLSFVQLVEELTTIDDADHCQSVAEEILVKFHRRKARLKDESLEQFCLLSDIEPEAFAELLRRKDPQELRDFFQAHTKVAPFLDKLNLSSGRAVLVSEHDDALVGTERGYGEATRPEDYLEGFKQYITQHGNELPALLVVTQRPRELTRQQLKELSLALDEAGYNVSRLRTAWSEVTNQDIAASIIGFIRSQALGSPLVPFEDRVDRAVQTVLASQQWTTPQRKWLERIGSQLRQEVIVDRAALDRGQFRAQGGFPRLNKIFDGKLEEVLGDLHDELWRDSA